MPNKHIRPAIITFAIVATVSTLLVLDARSKRYRPPEADGLEATQRKVRSTFESIEKTSREWDAYKALVEKGDLKTYWKEYAPIVRDLRQQADAAWARSDREAALELEHKWFQHGWDGGWWQLAITKGGTTTQLIGASSLFNNVQGDLLSNLGRRQFLISTIPDGVRENYAELEVASLTLAEKDQFALAGQRRKLLDVAVWACAGGKVRWADVYPLVLAWKGSAFSRQQRLRQVVASGELDGQMKALDQVERKIASLRDQAAPDSRTEIETLTALQQTLEREILARESDSLRREFLSDEEITQFLKEEIASQQGRVLDTQVNIRTALRRNPEVREMLGERLARGARALPGRVADSIPAGAVFVDFLEYESAVPQPGAGTYVTWDAFKGMDKLIDRQRRLVAFVSSASQPAELVDLGPMELIERAVAQWRAFHLGGDTPPRDDPGRELRARIWEPLLELVGTAKTVLISPDGVLSSFPFAALPGERADAYLIEDYAIVMVPVPRQLSQGPLQDVSSEPSMLLVGGIQFGLPPDRRPAPDDSADKSAQRGRTMHFQSLPGTDVEVKHIASQFKQAFAGREGVLLQGVTATEDRVRAEMTGKSFVHFATHGFVASHPVDASGLHPGSLAGLAVAGANDPPHAVEGDGILTAIEVSRLNLTGTDLVVASACETSLGTVFGAEGVLGMQRAFHAAGARTTLTSLWKIDDSATQILMDEFYRNLWSRKLGKLESLRQAQLTVMRRYDPRSASLRGVGGAQPIPTDAGRLPPFYWAGFVLSGDWK